MSLALRQFNPIYRFYVHMHVCTKARGACLRNQSPHLVPAPSCEAPTRCRARLRSASGGSDPCRRRKLVASTGARASAGQEASRRGVGRVTTTGDASITPWSVRSSRNNTKRGSHCKIVRSRHAIVPWGKKKTTPIIKTKCMSAE